MSGAEANRPTLLELLDALLKSWWTLVAGVALGLAGGLLVLDYMPKAYVAGTKIRVAPQSIPEEFVKSTVTDDMSRRLFEIKEAILSRSYMDKLIEQNFPPPADEAEREALIRMLRDRVKVVHSTESTLVSLIYQDTDAERTAQVVNQLTNLYIEQNRDFRAGQAASTRETFEQQAAEAKEQLDAVERRINDFNAAHSHETGAHLDANVATRQELGRELEGIRRDLAAQRRLIDDLELKRQQGAPIELPPGTKAPVRDSRSRSVAELQRELKDLRSRYGELHPNVVRKQRELDEALAARPQEEGSEGEPVATKEFLDPEQEALEQQIQAARREMETLLSKERATEREIGVYGSRIERTPNMQTQLSNLEEQRRVAAERYRDLKTKAEAARGSELLEETDRGQRLEVIEWAVVPFEPAFPDPLRVGLVAVLVGILLFVGPVILRAFLNPLVSSEAGLRTYLPVPVLVSIPRILTRETVGMTRRRQFKNAGLSFLAVAVLLGAVLLT